MADKRVAEAFHEVYNKVPKNVVKTGKTGAAKRSMMTAIALSKARQTGAKVPDKSGANYVSRNELHVEPQSPKGRTVPYRGVKGLNGESQETAVVTATSQSTPTGFGPSATGDGIDCVQPVARQMNPVEMARNRNNHARDSRVNLGRGKFALPEVE